MKIFVSSGTEGTEGVAGWEQRTGNGPRAAAGRLLGPRRGTARPAGRVHGSCCSPKSGPPSRRAGWSGTEIVADDSRAGGVSGWRLPVRKDS